MVKKKKIITTTLILVLVTFWVQTLLAQTSLRLRRDICSLVGPLLFMGWFQVTL